MRRRGGISGISGGGTRRPGVGSVVDIVSTHGSSFLPRPPGGLVVGVTGAA